MDAAVPLATVLHSGGEKAGIVVVALLAAAAVLGRSRRRRAQAMAATLLLAPALLLAEVWDTSQVHHLRNRPGFAIAAAAAGIVLVLLGAVLLRRHPRLFPLLALAALPFRIPISTGDRPTNLLVPLYLVVGAGALEWIASALRSRQDGRGVAGPDEPPERGWKRTRTLEIALLGFVVLYGIQATYSADGRTALQQMVFFYVPFALLFALLREVEFDAVLARRCLYVLVGLAFGFVCIGFVEYATGHVLLNPRVNRTNESASYFRVNSLFFDPNIYGRFLVVVMLAVTAAVLWSQNRRDQLLGVATLAAIWAGLVLTLSQSSFLALLIGLAVLAALRWSVSHTLVVAGVVVALGCAFALAFGHTLHLRGKNEDSGGRVQVVTGGLKLLRDRPVDGFGSGSFRAEYKKRLDPSARRGLTASHNTAITVGAEQGAIGLIAYLVLLAAALRALFGGGAIDVRRAAVAAAFCGLVLHTMFYSDFLEDPVAWALLGVGLAMSPPPGAGTIAERAAARRARRRRFGEAAEVAAPR